MSGGIGSFLSAVVEAVSLVVMSVFGGADSPPEPEVIYSGQPITVEIKAEPLRDSAAERVEGVASDEAVPVPSALPAVPPVIPSEEAAEVVLDNECVSATAGQELVAMANGQLVTVNADGVAAQVCASGDEGHGTTTVEAESDDGSASVNVRQRVQSSGEASVNSNVRVNVSTE